MKLKAGGFHTLESVIWIQPHCSLFIFVNLDLYLFSLDYSLSAVGCIAVTTACLMFFCSFIPVLLSNALHYLTPSTCRSQYSLPKGPFMWPNRGVEFFVAYAACLVFWGVSRDTCQRVATKESVTGGDGCCKLCYRVLRADYSMQDYQIMKCTSSLSSSSTRAENALQIYLTKSLLLR